MSQTETLTPSAAPAADPVVNGNGDGSNGLVDAERNKMGMLLLAIMDFGEKNNMPGIAQAVGDVVKDILPENFSFPLKDWGTEKGWLYYIWSGLWKNINGGMAEHNPFKGVMQPDPRDEEFHRNMQALIDPVAHAQMVERARQQEQLRAAEMQRRQEEERAAENQRRQEEQARAAAENQRRHEEQERAAAESQVAAQQQQPAALHHIPPTTNISNPSPRMPPQASVTQLQVDRQEFLQACDALARSNFGGRSLDQLTHDEKNRVAHHAHKLLSQRNAMKMLQQQQQQQYYDAMQQQHLIAANHPHAQNAVQQVQQVPMMRPRMPNGAQTGEPPQQDVGAGSAVKRARTSSYSPVNAAGQVFVQGMIPQYPGMMPVEQYPYVYARQLYAGGIPAQGQQVAPGLAVRRPSGNVAPQVSQPITPEMANYSQTQANFIQNMLNGHPQGSSAQAPPSGPKRKAGEMTLEAQQQAQERSAALHHQAHQGNGVVNGGAQTAQEPRILATPAQHYRRGRHAQAQDPQQVLYYMPTPQQLQQSTQMTTQAAAQLQMAPQAVAQMQPPHQPAAQMQFPPQATAQQQAGGFKVPAPKAPSKNAGRSSSRTPQIPTSTPVTPAAPTPSTPIMPPASTPIVPSASTPMMPPASIPAAPAAQAFTDMLGLPVNEVSSMDELLKDNDLHSWLNTSDFIDNAGPSDSDFCQGSVQGGLSQNQEPSNGTGSISSASPDGKAAANGTTKQESGNGLGVSGAGPQSAGSSAGTGNGAPSNLSPTKAPTLQQALPALTDGYVKPFKNVVGHTDKVFAVAFSKKGDTQLMASAGKDSTIKVWEVRAVAGQEEGDAIEIAELTGHTGQINNLRFLNLTGIAGPDAESVTPNDVPFLLASCGVDETVKVWDLTDLTNVHLVQTLVGHRFGVTSVDFVPVGIAGNASKAMVNGREMKVGLWAASLDTEGNGKIWEVWTGAKVKDFKLEAVKAAGFAPHNPLRFRPGIVNGVAHFVAGLCSSLYAVELPILADSFTVGDLKIHLVPNAQQSKKNICGLDWTPDGRWAVTCCEERVYLWDARHIASPPTATHGHEKLRLAATFPQQFNQIHSVGFLQSPDVVVSSAYMPDSVPPRVIFGEFENIFVWEAGTCLGRCGDGVRKVLAIRECNAGYISSVGVGSVEGRMVVGSASHGTERNLKVWVVG